MSKALYRKWRPMTFSDVVGQPQVTETLKKQIAGGRLSHAYLFTGTRGTGKTTCAKLLAKAANCLDPQNGEPCNRCAACLAINDGSAVDISEIDAASNSGVDNIRALRDQAAYTPVELRRRVYIIDECHMLSNGAWNALLKTLEEPPEHVLFILATTELHKIPPTILSRCQRFSFRRGTARDLAARVSEIAAAEGIALTEDGAAALARLADGGFRDAISMLDQCASAKEGMTLDEDAILEELGLAGSSDTLDTLKALARGDASAALEILASLYAAGKDMSAFLSELASAVRDALVLNTTRSSALLGGRYPAKSLAALGLSAAALSDMLGEISEAQARLARSASARLEAELCLVRLAAKAAAGGDASATEYAAPVSTAAPSRPAPSRPAPSPAPARVERPAASVTESAAPAKVERPATSAAASTEPPRVEQPAAPVTQVSPAAKADEDDDVPPWDDAPPPDDSFAPASEPYRAPAPKRAEPKQTAAGWWQDTLLEVRPQIPISNYMQLAAQPPAELNGDVVMVRVTSDFARKIVGDAKVIAALGRAASKVLGRTVTARCMTEGEQEKEKDAFDDLLAMQTRFDNFIVE